jgi:anti-anti-sigma regulatory factor
MSLSRNVFRTERFDDILVVIPTGAHIGYRLPQIERETDAIVARVKAAGFAGVIVDARENEYLSTAVIGAMVRMWEVVKNHGGQFVVCNLVDDALTALLVTRLDTRWPQFVSREAALNAVRFDVSWLADTAA